MQWLSIAIVAAVAVLFWWLSKQREKRLHVFTDKFARAFCEAADHIIPNQEETAAIKFRRPEGGYIEALPAAEQPEAIQKLLEQGVDAYIMDRLRQMYSAREEAQALLTSVNLVGDKYNAALNHCYDISNLFFSFIDDPKRLQTDEDLTAFTDYLYKQKFIRNTTLASIVSDKCKQEISVP